MNRLEKIITASAVVGALAIGFAGGKSAGYKQGTDQEAERYKNDHVEIVADGQGNMRLDGKMHGKEFSVYGIESYVTRIGERFPMPFAADTGNPEATGANDTQNKAYERQASSQAKLPAELKASFFRADYSYEGAGSYVSIGVEKR